MPAISIAPPLSLARWAGLMEEAATKDSGLNPPIKGLNVFRTGALGDRQTDRPHARVP